MNRDYVNPHKPSSDSDVHAPWSVSWGSSVEQEPFRRNREMKPKSRCTMGGGRENTSRNSTIKSTITEYVQKSTIHGAAYVGDDQRNKFERIWWFVMLVCAVFGACYSIYRAYRTMKDNPIIESPSLTRTATWEMPFPAVTVCPAGSDDLTPLEMDKKKLARMFLPVNITEMPDDSVYYSSAVLETLLLRRGDRNNYDLLTQILPKIDMDTGNFGTYPEDIEVPLLRTITQYGACLTFNMYQEKDLLRDGVTLSSLGDVTDQTDRFWSRDHGYSKNIPLVDNYTYPFRSFGPEDTLELLFNVSDTKFLRPALSEYSVSFHAPDELPLFGRHYEIISLVPGNDNYIEMKPQLVVSEGIEHYKPEVRQCYYSNERYLKFYKSYTQNHCEMECLANYTLAQCGCVLYYLPHFSDTKLCLKEYDCYFLEFLQFFLHKLKVDGVRAPVDDCNCLPSCTQLSYEPVRTKTLDRPESGNETKVFIRHQKQYISKHIRSELHSFSEFFSNCGGSLGLFPWSVDFQLSGIYLLLYGSIVFSQ